MSQDNRKDVQRVLIITLALNLLVMLLKAALGWVTGSLSLMADALHSVTDSANNILGMVTNRLADPRPDPDHPYGHQKYDAIGALGIAVFLAIACFEILKAAVGRILEGGSPVTLDGPDLLVLVVVLAVNILVTTYEHRMGRRLGSSILIADARHTLSDVWVTTLVLLGLIAVWQGQVWHIAWMGWLDVALSFPVALLVLRSGWQVLRENLPWLVDEYAIPAETILGMAMETPGVVNCHAIASRGIVGRQVFIEMHMVVNTRDVDEAHRITEAVEQRLGQAFGPARVSIHIEPRDYQSDAVTYDAAGGG